MPCVQFDTAFEAARKCLDLLQKTDNAMALTGAGVSTDSGIPDFRSANGLWSKYPQNVMSKEFFYNYPAKFYNIHRQFLDSLLDAQPNTTHKVLSLLEEQKFLSGVTTQNIDGLHEKAGQKTVLNCHGSVYTCTCTGCLKQYTIKDFLQQYDRYQYHCPECRGLIKPDVTLFGEPLPEDFLRAVELIRKTDFLLVLGTSLVVYPVAGLVDMLFGQKATIFIVNRDTVHAGKKADYLYYGDLAEFSGCLWNLLQKSKEYEE